MTEANKTEKAPAKKTAAKPAAKKAAGGSGKKLRLKQIRSGVGHFEYQRQTLIGLRLNKIGRVSELEDTPAVRGMVAAVAHLVEVEEIAA